VHRRTWNKNDILHRRKKRMKPWFNTALIIGLTLIWIVIGWQLHKRLSYLEMIQKVKQVSEAQLIFQHNSWHKRMEKND
jgi:hypothetical protein